MRRENTVITQIDHIEIIVKDVKEYVDFYQKLGFKLLQWTDHHGGSAELQLPGPNQPIFEIHTVIDEENIGVNHIAFKTDDLITTYEDEGGRHRVQQQPYRNRTRGGAMSASATPTAGVSRCATAREKSRKREFPSLR